MKRIVTLSVITIVLFLSTVSFAETYGGGTGEPNNPYQIWTPQQMNTIGANPADWDKCFKLMTDIDMSAYTGTQYKIIGNLATKFTGRFNGNNHVIRNLTYYSTIYNYIGLFGYIFDGAEINNLGVENINITGRYNVGGLIGYNTHGTVSCCYTTGFVTGIKDSVGGLIGCNSGPVSNCYSMVNVSGSEYVGGLIGDTAVYTVANCYSICSVYGTGYYVGGLIGRNSFSTVSSCFWDIQTSGRNASSAGRGLTTEQMKTMSIYQNAGWADKGWVINDGIDYPHLEWEGTTGTPIPDPLPVPLLGSGTEQNPYQVWTVNDFMALSWNVDILDKHISLMADLDLNGVFIYPIGDLGNFKGSFHGNGHIINKPMISQPTSCSVGIFRYVDYGGEINDLNVININITGDSSVGGLIGINKGTVSNSYSMGVVNGNDNVGGLIGFCLGKINYCSANCSVRGTGNDTGGLIGSNNGTVSNCYSMGNFIGNVYTGGLIGYNTSMISNCFSIGNSSGTDYVGGLIGSNGLATSNCYSTGLVSGDNYIGGLIGENYGTVKSCYSIGNVSGNNYVGGLIGTNHKKVIACFWDVSTSGQTNGIGEGLTDSVYGRTTTQMKQQATFTVSPYLWDFLGAINGTNDYWRMCVDNVDYPRLTWEYIQDGDFACPDGISYDDLQRLGNDWLVTYTTELYGADADGNKTVNFLDFAILSENWLQ
jgi:hypothetical protein